MPLIWLLALVPFWAVVVTKSPNGDTTVFPYGIAAAPICWILIWANRGYLGTERWAAVVAGVGVVVALGMAATGWSYI